MARSDLGLAAVIDPVPEWAMNAAAEGRLVILPAENDRVRALIKLGGFIDNYLYVARSLQRDVIAHTRQIQTVTRDYQRLEEERYGIQITFVMIFIVVALLVLLSAVWLGLQFANRIAHPIGGLIAAADRVRAGELAARRRGTPARRRDRLPQPCLQSDDWPNPQPAAGICKTPTFSWTSGDASPRRCLPAFRPV